MEFFPSPIPLQAYLFEMGSLPVKKNIYKLTVHIEFNHDTTQTRYLAIFQPQVQGMFSLLLMVYK